MNEICLKTHSFSGRWKYSTNQKFSDIQECWQSVRTTKENRYELPYNRTPV